MTLQNTFCFLYYVILLFVDIWKKDKEGEITVPSSNQ